MANLQVKDIDDKLYAALKYYAKKEHRSVSQEVIKIIELYLQNNKGFKNTTQEFLNLAGSWDDERTVDEIINDISKSRTKNKRFDDFDLLIGSTALTMNYTLVTNNVTRFKRIPGLKIENWVK